MVPVGMHTGLITMILSLFGMELKVRHYHAKQGNEMNSAFLDHHSVIDDPIRSSRINRSDSLLDTLRITSPMLYLEVNVGFLFVDTNIT